MSAGLASPVDIPVVDAVDTFDPPKKDTFEKERNGYVASSGSGEEWEKEDQENNAKFWMYVCGMAPKVPEEAAKVEKVAVKDKPKKVSKKKGKKIVEEVVIAPAAIRSPFQRTQTLIKRKTSVPKRLDQCFIYYMLTARVYLYNIQFLFCWGC